MMANHGNIFLDHRNFSSTSRQSAQQDKQPKKQEFLNSVSDLTRDMYNVERRDIPVSQSRMTADMLLNQSSRQKEAHKDKDRLIRDLSEEVKSLKQKMGFVIEKDETIYRLQCENELLKKDIAEYQSTTVTDESLKRDNKSLNAELSESRETIVSLEATISEMSEEMIKIKKKLISLYQSRQGQSQVKALEQISDQTLGSVVKRIINGL